MSNILIEGTLRERFDALTSRRRDAWLAAAALGALVVVALMLWGRGATARIAPPATASVPAPAVVLVASPSPGVFVDVGGAVRAPGLYSLAPGARVADALAAAGGARPRADLSGLNLAQVVEDGTKVHVARRGPHAPELTGPAAAASPAPSSGSPVVSLKSADQAALETVPGIGPVTALAILDFRDEVGAFESVDQLLEVDGIGPATLEEIRPYLTV